MNDGRPDSQDTLFAEKLPHIHDFVFNASVTRVFNDMVRRSVPGYDTIIQMIGVIGLDHANRLGRPVTCVDYGCSRGAATKSLLTFLGEHVAQIHAVDSSKEMLETAQSEINDPRVSFSLADILEFKVERADIAVLNLVLQFIEPASRLTLLNRIRHELANDGMLILTEKIKAEPEMSNYHLAFKRAMGYSELEITQKRDALERVMVIDSIEEHQQRLHDAGFSQVHVWFRLLNWASFIALP